MKSVFLVFIAFFFYVDSIIGQPYVTGGNTRYRFAQTTIGIDYRFYLNYGSESSTLNSSGAIEKFKLKNQDEVRLIIGATHFWGHADFYVAFPITSIGKSGFETEIELGAKYFPWRIESGKVRPYIGSGIITGQYYQDRGASQIRNLYPITGGFVFDYKNHLFELGAGFIFNNKENYYISPVTSVQIKTQPFWISLCYKFMIDLTMSQEKNWLSGKTKKLTDSLTPKHRLDGITIAIGPSSTFYLRSSPHNKNIAPYIDNHKITNFYPEFAIGYYLSKLNLQAGFAYRSVNNKIEAYNFSQKVMRKALTFEICKFVCDYKGFDPYIGPAVSYEWLNVIETNSSGITLNQKYEGVKPGITFGFEIRPTKLMFIYVRSNLRYFPNLKVKMNDSKYVYLDQLEFDFFQVVFFPQRIGIGKKAKAG